MEHKHESAVSTALAIPELREAILVEFALTQQRAWLREEKYLPRPVLELFPLKRISRAFAATIEQSLHLRSLMCLDRGTGFTTPVRWFLSTLNMRCSKLWQKWPAPDMLMHSGQWLVLRRKIRVFPADYNTNEWIHLDFVTDVANQTPHPAQEHRNGAHEMRFYAPDYNNHTLSDVYRAIENAIRDAQPEILELRGLRAKRESWQAAEKLRLQVDLHRDEINTVSTRGLIDLNAGEGQRGRQRVPRRAELQDFPSWRKAQRQREYESELRFHQAVCLFCQNHGESGFEVA